MESFFAYFERLELFGFFSGYPLVFALVLFIAGPDSARNDLKKRLVRSLPFAYALTGSCYAAMILFHAWPQVNVSLVSEMQEPWLRVWALLSLLFWLPVLARVPIISLIHSLVFFYFLVRDLLFYFRGKLGKELIRNEMKVYGDSLLTILAALVFIFILFTLISKFRETRDRG